MAKLQDVDLLDELFLTSDNVNVDNAEAELDNPTLIINLDEVNDLARKEAVTITERLSNYFFDQKYIDEHPYIPAKIQQEMNNIRRLLKMLSVNEAAQDALIKSITSFSGKGSLYSSLTSLQNTMLSIQTQLNSLTTSLENIFKEMQDECEKTWEEKDKEQAEDGSFTVRGSRDFIKEIRMMAEKSEENDEVVDTETGEIIKAS